MRHCDERTALAPGWDMRQLLRIVLLLVFVLATGCIYGRSKGSGTNTGSGVDKQGGPWTQGDPPSQAFVPER